MEKTDIKIAFLSTYPPRQCGLATFTNSLTEIFEKYVSRQIKIIAVSDAKYAYSPRVVFALDQQNRQSYLEAAHFVNASDIEIIVLEHEYGIFGGKDGKYILDFLENINKPIVTSLHSVLKEHSPHRRELTQKILNLSNSVIVMTKSAKQILVETMSIQPSKISIVRHGTPNIRFDEKHRAKKLLGLEGKTVASTFGLLNRGKGIEIAIDAIKSVVEEHPDTVYFILGATHPTILKKEGEKYREELANIIKKNKLEKNIFLINQYLDYKDLVMYLTATDIYLSPQLDFNQAFSGTISYALGCGCAIISSPTNYAQEILADNRGIIVLPQAELIADEIKKLTKSPATLAKIALKAYQFGRKMIWSSTGLKYLQVVEANLFVKNDGWVHRLPNFKSPPPLKHFDNLTTDFGIIQHSIGNRPDPNFGYSLDDQARALMVSQICVEEGIKNIPVRQMVPLFLRYFNGAVDSDGKIHNFFNIHKSAIDEGGSDDSVARSFWALASLKKSNIFMGLSADCEKLLNIYENNLNFKYIRSTAYALLGYAKLKRKAKVKILADRLFAEYLRSSDNEWKWFEDELTWGNAILILALCKAYRLLGTKKYFSAVLQTLSFLEKHSTQAGYPAPIGQKNWFRKGQTKSLYDQQPLEAANMVMLYNELFDLTGDKKYKDKALSWFGWYFGNNIKQTMTYNSMTEGVHDGLTESGLNPNQGAESIITFLLAYFSFNRNI